MAPVRCCNRAKRAVKALFFRALVPIVTATLKTMTGPHALELAPIGEKTRNESLRTLSGSRRIRSRQRNYGDDEVGKETFGWCAQFDGSKDACAQ